MAQSSVPAEQGSRTSQTIRRRKQKHHFRAQHKASTSWKSGLESYVDFHADPALNTYCMGKPKHTIHRQYSEEVLTSHN